MIRRLSLVPLLCAVATAQETSFRRIEARVTAVTSGGIYLDQGADAGIEQGDRARVFGAGGTTVELIVRSVTRQSVRCEALTPGAEIVAGEQAEVLVPRERSLVQATGGQPAPTWTHPKEEWDPNAPLLAPAVVQEPPDRPSSFSGRWYSALDATWDRSGDHQRYLLGRTGFDGRWENASGIGDVVQFDGEFFHRESEDGNGTDDSRDRVRVDRASWRLGDWRENDTRMEFGRFLHSELPQLGLIDGGEYVQRTASGSRFGVSAGFLPIWNANLDSGDDLAVSAFYRYYGGDDGELSIGGALQKTWHKGQSDRDAALADFSWRANERWWLAGSAWLDWYDSDDMPKSSGLELTEAHLSARYQPSREWGLSTALSHVRWPVMLRNDLPPATVATLADGQVDRASLNAWRDFGSDLRVSGRLDTWSTQDDDGLGGEARVGKRDWLWEQGELWGALFTMDGERSDVAGLRLGASRWTSAGSFQLNYEYARYDQAQTFNSLETLVQQTVRATWDFALGRYWSASLRGELYFGDQQDATAAGLWLQRRF